MLNVVWKRKENEKVIGGEVFAYVIYITEQIKINENDPKPFIDRYQYNSISYV